MLNRIIKYLRNTAEGEHFSDNSREMALDLIETYGLKAHRYFAAISNRQDAALASALDTLQNLGYIVTDKDGNLVGKVATARLDSNSIALQRRATIKVISF